MCLIYFITRWTQCSLFIVKSIKLGWTRKVWLKITTLVILSPFLFPPKKQVRRKGEWIAKIKIKSHAFLLDLIKNRRNNWTQTVTFVNCHQWMTKLKGMLLTTTLIILFPFSLPSLKKREKEKENEKITYNAYFA